jgi:hypothetical protein
VGAALVLAVTTALIAGGGEHAANASATQMLDAFRPGLVLSTAVALAGFAVALAPMRRAARRR